MSDADQLAKVLRQVCAIAGRRLLYRDERAVVDQAVELADRVLAGQPGRDQVAELRDWCIEHGHAVLPGDLVEAEVAAELLGVGVGRLRNIGPRLAHHRRGRRVYYPLSVLAKHNDISHPGRAFPCSTGTR